MLAWCTLCDCRGGFFRLVHSIPRRGAPRENSSQRPHAQRTKRKFLSTTVQCSAPAAKFRCAPNRGLHQAEIISDHTTPPIGRTAFLL